MHYEESLEKGSVILRGQVQPFGKHDRNAAGT